MKKATIAKLLVVCLMLSMLCIPAGAESIAAVAEAEGKANPETLIEDVNANNWTVDANKTYIIDLNGHALTGGTIAVESGATFTAKYHDTANTEKILVSATGVSTVSVKENGRIGKAQTSDAYEINASVTLQAGATFTCPTELKDGVEFIKVDGVTNTASSSGDNTVWTAKADEATTYTATFTVTGLADGTTATIVVKDGEVTVDPNEDGSYTLDKNKTYTYTVSAAGYEDATGTITEPTAEVAVTMTAQSTTPATYTATFKVTGPATDAATIVVKNGEETVTANADGSYTLKIGTTYTYTVSAKGYEDATGTITAPATGDTTTVEVTMKESTPATNPDQEKVDAAKAAIEAATYTFTQAEANTSDDVKAALVEKVNAALKAANIELTVTVDDIKVPLFSAATAGDADDEDGLDGSFKFTVALKSGDATATAEATGTITATPYDKTPVNPDVSVDVTPDANGNTSAEVSSDAITSAIEKAKDEQAPGTDDKKIDVNELTIKATSSNGTENVAVGTTAEVTLPAAAVSTLVSNEVTTVTVKTDVGDVSLPQEILTDENGNAKTSNLKLVVEKAEKTTADVSVANKVVNTFKVEVHENGKEAPIEKLEKPIKLRFYMGQQLKDYMLAFVDKMGAIKRIATTGWDGDYIVGTVNHLTEFVVVTPDVISDYYTISNVSDKTDGGAGKVLVVELTGKYDGKQVVTACFTYKEENTQRVITMTQSVIANGNKVTFSFSGNPTKVDLYVSDDLPNLNDGELGSEVYDSRQA